MTGINVRIFIKFLRIHMLANSFHSCYNYVLFEKKIVNLIYKLIYEHTLLQEFWFPPPPPRPHNKRSSLLTLQCNLTRNS